MKIFKNIILASAVALSALSLASCDKKEVKHGDGDAVVGFAQDTYSFKESAGIVKVPVQITGTPLNYPSTFDVKAEAVDLVNLAKLEDLVLFTQTTEFKDNGNGTVYVEFKIKDDTEINDDRSFKLTVVNLQGAKLADLAETTVVIKDNDNNPYEKLWGDWVFHGSKRDGSAGEFNFNISGGFTDEEQEANADKVLVCWGAEGYQWADDHTPVWYMSYDADAQQVAILAGKQMTVPGVIDWGLGGDQYVVSCSWNPAEGTVSEEVDLVGSWSKDLNTITFTPGLGFGAMIYNETGWLKYTWFTYHTITLTRK